MAKVGFYRAADLVTPPLHSLNAQLMLERGNPWDGLVFGTCKRSSSLSSREVMWIKCYASGAA